MKGIFLVNQVNRAQKLVQFREKKNNEILRDVILMWRLYCSEQKLYRWEQQKAQKS
jgi:hypothetical protein